MRKEEIFECFAEKADRSFNVVTALPLIEMLSDQRVLIENHCGIVLYSREEIEIKLRIGSLNIIGCGLYISYMSKQRIVIHGTVRSLSICRR